MSEVNRADRLPLPVPFKKEGGPPVEGKKLLGPAEFWDKLNQMADMTSAARALAVLGPAGETKTVEGKTTETKPWEGISEVAKAFGINLGELWRTREDELKAAREGQTATEKELHEMRVREIDHRVEELKALADKTRTSLLPAGPPGPTETGRPKSFLEELDEMTSGRIKERLGAMLFPTTSPASPKDPMEDFLERLEWGDKVKERLGITPGRDRLGDVSSMRSEIVKLLLEDERETLRIEKDHEVAMKRAEHVGDMVSTVKEYAPDFLGALSDTAKAFSPGARRTSPPPEPPVLGIKCVNPECGQDFTVPRDVTWPVECPHCHTFMERETE